MPRRRRCCNSYIGLYSRRSRSSVSNASRSTACAKLHCLWKNLTDNLYELYCTLCDNYTTVVVIFTVLLLSLFIPTIVKAIYNTSEVKGLKKILDLMTRQVAQAETDSKKVADEICSIHCAMKDIETETPPSRFDCCPSCEKIAKAKSQSVQANKRNVFQRLFRINQKSSQNLPDKSPQKSPSEPKNDSQQNSKIQGDN